MAKNYAHSGSAPVFTAPAGGVLSGIPVAIGDLVVIPLDDAVAGEEFVGHTGGAWTVPATAGLTTGAKVAVLSGELVADGTAESTPCGKLLSDEAGGQATFLLVQ